MNKKSLAALLAVFVLAGSLGTVCLGATTETEASSDGDVASSGDTGITIGLPQDLDSSLGLQEPEWSCSMCLKGL